MRTKQDLLDYIDRVSYVGVDKTESQSQFAVIDVRSDPDSGTPDEIPGKMLAPLVENTDERESADCRGN
ncbi:MAG TPA: hypothetical protein VMF08_14395 [Candidatus Sulfotelmatobacter sp.]|nr:hypothetical protein [Candidatus Sulfotelmatobacter sp.]